MDKVKIVHCADLHFDTPFSDLDTKLSKIRQDELRDTFSKIIHLCKVKNAEILLIAGDVFDNSSVKKITLQFLKEKFMEIPEVRIFIVAGNHDPLNNRSFYNMIDWPSNVHIFSNQFESVVIEELNTVVIGASFKESYEKKSLLRDYNSDNSFQKYIKLMILHGDVSQVEDGNEYNPITETEIARTSVDYLALGHKHAFSGIKRSGNTFYAYCGCPEGRGYDELGEKGVIIGEVYRENVQLEFVPTNKRNYKELQVDVSGIISKEGIVKRVLSEVDSNSINDIYRILLKGEIDEDFVVDINSLQNSLERYFFSVKVKDDTTIKVDVNKLSKEYSIKGLFSAKMLEKINTAANEEEKEKLIRAFKIGLQSLSKEEVNLGDN
ncbi:metallophosphoesterase family protein [Inconstantimicrobium mannanitabidum]|uniref:Nuclease SbcCD subunit D n=1 Tax=Inconstantimicrobium mannanitabidum TaxID=1604901 RepID=A0ACB5R7S9_9CLOT|nr:DNA repair exonuclease [Clostridium sp. TW13]GKX65074.1 nuclease SbcCD subunit D [Clostridium sp. TW13]